MNKLTVLEFNHAPAYLKIDVVVEDYKIDSLKAISTIAIDKTLHLTLKIDATEKLSNAEPTSIKVDDIVIDNTVVIASVESNNHQYVLKSQTLSNIENNGVEVSLVVTKKYSSHCENINPVDPLLMFYRKLLPYSRYKIFGTFKDEFYELGTIERITYDTELKKYKLYSSQGVVIYYDKLPLLNPSKVDIAGTQYTNPPTLVWLLDTQDLDDLMFIDTVKPKSIIITDDRFKSLKDWVDAFNKGSLNIQKLSVEVRSINKRVIIDLQTYTTLDYSEFLRFVNYDIVQVFKIPFKQVYFKIKDDFTLTRIIINYDDNNSIQIDGNFVYHTAK